MQKRRLLINALTSAAQVLTVGAGYAFLYRFLLAHIGAERIGIWSVVIAATSMANAANLGLSASTIKFVAKYLALGREETVSVVVQTTVITLGLFCGVVLLAVYPFSGWIFSHIVPVSRLAETASLLPYVFFSMWITVIGSVFLAGLDGCQRIDIRAGLVMSGTLIFLALSFVLVPAHGLMGLAYARIAQDSFTLGGGWLMLKRRLRSLPVFCFKWDKRLFREMLGYGANFQLISASMMLCDPLTKGMLARFGGLGMAGIYEMASRMIGQLRALLVTAGQALVPAIADLHEKEPETVQKLYGNSYRLIFYIAVPYFSIIIALIPVISVAWIGYYNGVFVSLSIMLAVGWFINTLCAPAYFANLGIGGLGWNTAAHVVMAASNIALGLLFGRFFGGTAVAAAWVFSLILGSIIIIVSYHIKNGVPLINIFPGEHIKIAVTSLAAIFISALICSVCENRANLLETSCLILLANFLVVFIPAWRNPMRRKLLGWLTAELF